MKLPREEFESRISRTQALLKERGLDAAFVYYDEFNIANGWYLTAWCPQFESGAVLVPVEGMPLILGGPESEPFAKLDAMVKETRNVPVFMVPEEEYPGAKISSFDEIFQELFGSKKVKRLGIVGVNRIPLAVYRQFEVELKGIELIDITAEFEAFRVIKSDWEIEMIRKSFQIAGEAFRSMMEAVKPGITEHEVAAAGEYRARILGAEGFGFKTIAASEIRSNAVVPTSSEKKLEAGELLLAGISVKYNGYCSAAGASLPIGGKPSPAQRQYIDDVKEAFIRTREKLKPGMTAKEIDSPAREYLKSRGYGPYQLVPYVHTIGLLEAEAPFFGPRSKAVLKPNMTVCIDVSLFGHPTLYGIRVETGYRVTENGYEPLSPFMENLILNL